MKNNTQIYKGIIEQCLPNNTYKVRVPEIDGSNDTTNSTRTVDLDTAKLCTLPGVYPNLSVNDEVFITYLDNDYAQPLILGVSFDSDVVKENSKFGASDLDVKNTAKLPEQTTIGPLTPSQIKYLANLSQDMDIDLDKLKSDIQTIDSRIAVGKENPNDKADLNALIYFQIIDQ